jgi:hypothetical protein
MMKARKTFRAFFLSAMDVTKVSGSREHCQIHNLRRQFNCARYVLSFEFISLTRNSVTPSETPVPPNSPAANVLQGGQRSPANSSVGWGRGTQPRHGRFSTEFELLRRTGVATSGYKQERRMP